MDIVEFTKLVSIIGFGIVGLTCISLVLFFEKA